MATYPVQGTNPWFTDLQTWLYTSHEADGTQKRASVGPAFLEIATNDANATIKARADYLADGTGDESQVNTAYTDLSSFGGIIKISAGRIFIQNPITFTTANKMVHLLGDDPSTDYTRGGTTIAPNLSGNTGLNNRAMVEIGQTSYMPRCTVSGIAFDGRNTTTFGAGQLDAIWLTSYKGWIYNCNFYQLNGHAIVNGHATTNASTDSIIHTCQSQNIRGNFYTTAGAGATDVHLLDNIVHGCGDATAGAKLGSGHAIHLTTGSAGSMVRGGHVYDNNGGGIVNNAVVQTIADVKIENNDYGVDNTAAGDFISILDCDFRGNSRTTDNVTSNIRIQNTANPVIYVGGRNVATTWPTGTGQNQAKHGVECVGTITGLAIVGILFHGGAGTTPNTFGTSKISNAPVNATIANCPGFVTDKHWSQATTAGTSSQAITHGLDVTPAIGDLSFAFAADPGTNNRIWFTSIGATTFTVNWTTTNAVTVGISHYRTTS